MRRAQIAGDLLEKGCQGGADIGAVGGRLILPSGRLQEAGCILWADGVSTGIAAGLPPDAPEAMTRRDAHYCSGAFLMTPAAVWRELGGFDEVFAPGYYEEADYCMRLRRSGRRVVFEPAVAALHFHLGSEAKAGDALRASERNRLVFCARHAAVLKAEHPPAAQRQQGGVDGPQAAEAPSAMAGRLDTPAEPDDHSPP